MPPNIDEKKAPTKPLFETDLKQLEERLFSFDTKDFRNHVPMSPAECLTVCHLATELLKTHSICLTLQSPMNIVGDIHGQFHDLLRIFDSLGHPPESRYLFLGDFVDRGRYSLEVMTLLFSLMLLHPGSVFLLRGNHETAGICCRYGFKAEILQRFPKGAAQKVLNAFLCAFQWLPLCAILDGRFFCSHGGISPSFMLPPFSASIGRAGNLQALSNTQRRPLEPKRSGLAIDLLWSDPGILPIVFAKAESETMEANWVPSHRRQCSYVFSDAALSMVMKVFRTQVLVRGHQVAQGGFKVNHDKRCITLFSAPGYCGVQTNSAAVLQVHESAGKGQSREVGTFFVMKPPKRDPEDLDYLFWADLVESA